MEPLFKAEHADGVYMQTRSEKHVFYSQYGDCNAPEWAGCY
jgi:hypothetical protein